MPNLIPFERALETLWTDCQTLEAPQVIIGGIVTVLENPIKLFCLVGNSDLAIGAVRCPPGLYASDFFVELMQAVRALDWEVVCIILEQANSPHLQTAAIAAHAHRDGL
jgi:TRAP-type C4-dicarboxylate transport system permease large subunit